MSTKKIEWALLFLALVGSLLAVEIFLRLFYPTPYYGYRGPPPQQKLFEYDSVLGWKGRPNAEGIFAGRDFHVSVALDKYGYRNNTPPFIEGRSNFIVLGDS